MLATFMEVLDTTVVNVSIPHIAGNLAASNEEGTWVVTSYLVSNAIVLPISGWLGVTVTRKALAALYGMAQQNAMARVRGGLLLMGVVFLGMLIFLLLQYSKRSKTLVAETKMDVPPPDLHEDLADRGGTRCGLRRGARPRSALTESVPLPLPCQQPMCNFKADSASD
jgi:hypothetical protein